MSEKKIFIFDTTLRDGEQSPGATMTSAEKLEVAREGGKDNRLPQVFAYGAHRLYGKKTRASISNIE